MHFKNIFIFFLAVTIGAFSLTFFEIGKPATVILYMFVGFLGLGAMRSQLKIELIERLQKVAPHLISDYSFPRLLRRDPTPSYVVRVFFNKELSAIKDKKVVVLVSKLRAILFFIFLSFLTLIPLFYCSIKNPYSF